MDASLPNGKKPSPARCHTVSVTSASLKQALLNPRPTVIISIRIFREWIMRFAIDTVDDSGNDRIYIGTPIGITENALRLQLREGEVKLEIRKIIDWFQIDRSENGEKVELFPR
jgi:hypothetical protein